MDRRQFLRYAAAVSATPLLSGCGGPARHIVSRDGLLELSLTARTLARVDEPTELLTYNAQSPGPLLEARAGDTVRLTLINRLETPTNLHHHGLHISPQVDNVFLEVPPGERHTYEFQIPANHPAMTGWYHPHYHLNVAPQVFGGLAGALVIRGELDDIPELQQAEEALLVLQDFGATPSTPHALGRRWGREGVLQLANGQRNPVVPVGQNGLLRLRLINASASRIYRLRLQNHPWFLMATDRGAIAAPTALDTLVLAPGERAELLIPAQQEPGDYRLLSLPYDRGIGTMVASLGTAVDTMAGVVKPRQTTLATLRYQASEHSEPLPLPQQLLPVTPLPTPITTREFVLNHGIDATVEPTGFIINDKSFDINRVDTQVRLNQVEDWHIVNRASIDHPFHLHTNRFQVIARNGQPESLLAWKDTVGIKGNESVTIRVRFEDFVGRTVYHCHILDHEDQGMMGIVEIL
ncbi:MAG: multicopper oxidase family protein [Cyanobacteria bacterium P01_H01_bin.26]